MSISTKYRSEATEIMDDFELRGDLLRKTLLQLDKINAWLGGNGITKNGVRKLWAKIPKDRKIVILDLGCGSGDMLRIIDRMAAKEGRKVRLIGVDANAYTLEQARSWTTDYPNISYEQFMVPSVEFDAIEFDIALATLFLHHFKDQEILNLIKVLKDKAKLGLVINDLHRNQIAYFLFYIVSRFIPNVMVQKDGLTSILRGFKRSELEAYSTALNLKDSQINWRWAFRFQWIIKSSN